jgi:hypothetical protein
VEAALLLLLAVAPAAARTVKQEIALARPSTREVAAAWIREHVPHGATLLKESYTPDFGWWEYQVVQRRFAGRFSMPELRDPGHDYLLLASAAYGRFEQPERFLKPHHREFARLYQQVFTTFPLVRRWEREEYRQGPELRLYRIPDPPGCGSPAGLPAALPAATAFVPDGSMRPRPKRPIEYTVDGQWSAFKGCFDAGAYRVTVRGEPAGPGELEVAAVAGIAGSAGEKLGRAPLDGAGGREVRLPRRGKYLFYVYLPVGSRVRGVTVERENPLAPAVRDRP